MLFASSVITIYCLFIAALLGSVAASFLDCMAWRIVHGEPVWKGRSHCDSCGHVLSAGDLVPVFGYLLHRGKCRYCGCKLSPCHLIYELTGAVVFMTLLLRFDISVTALEAVLFCALLMGASFADIYGFLIPDRFIVTGIVLRVVFLLIFGLTAETIADALLGGFAVTAVLLLVVFFCEKVMKREAMGGGDIKLIFMMGLYLGWQKNILALFFGCIIGILFGLLTQKKRSEDDSLEDKRIFPWGPSLAIAAYLTLLCGDTLIDAYLGLF